MRKLIIIAALLASTPAFAGDTTEKATLFAATTIAEAMARCPKLESDAVNGKVGWAIVAAFAQNDKDYTSTWGEAISKTVKAAALFPSFCKDVENAYGPNGIAAPELPWVRSPDAATFRGMLK
jgi:hypothetical protein